LEPKTNSVLVIEHDHETRVSLRRALEVVGCVVVSATSAAEACRYIAQIRLPNLIILASGFPSMSGAECLAQLRSEINLENTPVCQLMRAGDQRIVGTSCEVTKDDLSNAFKLLGGVGPDPESAGEKTI
jgi:PleD family two-component response regulator